MAEREGFGTLMRFWNPQATDSTLRYVPYVLFVPTTIARYCTLTLKPAPSLHAFTFGISRKADSPDGLGPILIGNVGEGAPFRIAIMRV